MRSEKDFLPAGKRNSLYKRFEKGYIISINTERGI